MPAGGRLAISIQQGGLKTDGKRTIEAVALDMLSGPVRRLPRKDDPGIGSLRHVVGEVERPKEILHVLTRNGDGDMTIFRRRQRDAIVFGRPLKTGGESLTIVGPKTAAKLDEEEIGLDGTVEGISLQIFNHRPDEDEVVQNYLTETGRQKSGDMKGEIRLVSCFMVLGHDGELTSIDDDVAGDRRSISIVEERDLDSPSRLSGREMNGGKNGSKEQIAFIDPVPAVVRIPFSMAIHEFGRGVASKVAA
jgi:hypothetical protein